MIKRIVIVSLLAIMLGLVAMIPVDAQGSISSEIIEKRTQTSKTFDLGDGSFALCSSIGAIHYGGDGWQEIDNELVPATAPWDWQMLEADYHIGVKEDFTAGQILQFRKQGSVVNFQPMALEWTNDYDMIQQIAMPQDVSPTITNPEVDLLSAVGVLSHQGTIRWNNAYGEGIDFRWQCNPTRLIKVLEIESLSKLPTPEQYIIDGGNVALRLNLIFDPSIDLDIYVNDELWDKSSKVQTFGMIEFRKSGEVLWNFMPLRYWGSSPESEENEGQSVATLEKSGKSLYISIRIPYEWLQSATYPVFVDPSVEIMVAAGADDCLRRFDVSSFSRTTVNFRAGYMSATAQDNGSAARFLNVTIPASATITLARLQLTARVTAGEALTIVNTRLRCERNINSVTFDDQTDFDARTWTTAYANWDGIGAWVNNTTYNSTDFKSSVQEVIDLPSWASGNPLTVLWDDWEERSTQANGRARTAHSYDSSTTKAPELYIEYLVAPPAPPSWLTLTRISNTEINAVWENVGANITYLLKMSLVDYPSDPEGNEVVAYSGNLTSANSTGHNLDLNRCYFSLWSHKNPYSGNYTTAEIGGESMEEFAKAFQEFAITAEYFVVIAQQFVVFLFLVLFSVLAFWRLNAVLFMLVAGTALMAGFYWYNAFTDNLGLTIGLMMLMYALVCVAFAFRCIFWREGPS